MQPKFTDWLACTPKGPKPRKPLKRTTKPRPMSPKRQGESRVYADKRKAFLEAHPRCEAFNTIVFWAATNWKYEARAHHTWYVCPDPQNPPPSTEIHHTRKPRSKYLNDESSWLAVCRWSHEWIENNKGTARQLGLLV